VEHVGVLILMSIHLGPGEWSVIGISAFLGIWFLAGIAVNRKLGRDFHALLCGSPDKLTLLPLSWVDLSTAGISIKAGRSGLPLERLEAVLVLERRENCPLWAFQRLAGKRDSVIIRAALNNPPDFELHLIPSSDYALRSGLTQGGERPLECLEAGGGMLLLSGGRPAERTLAAVKSLADRLKNGLLRVSVRRDFPHLLLHVQLSAFHGSHAESLMGMVGNLAKQG
jgi:hypothetical protein